MSDSVLISEHVRGFLEKQVAEGRHRTASEALEEAVRRYESDLAAEDQELSAAVAGGLAALEQGDYTDVLTLEDARALWQRIRLRADMRAEEIGRIAHALDRASGDNCSA